MQGIPHIPKELLEYLEGICPDQSPSLNTPDREIWFQAGKVDLIRHIRSVFEEQNRSIIEGD